MKPHYIILLTKRALHKLHSEQNFVDEAHCELYIFCLLLAHFDQCLGPKRM
jgi:hypothetical protein